MRLIGYLALLVALDLAVISCAPEESEIIAPTQAQESPGLEHRIRGALAGKAIQQSPQNRAWIELGNEQPCGSDQECPYAYTCVEQTCIPPEDKPGLEWCDGIDNDGDLLVDEDQIGDKTFCDRSALQPPTNYIFKEDQSYYVEAFEKLWNEPDANGIPLKDRWKYNNAAVTKTCEIINGNSVYVDRPYNLQRPMKALLTMYQATQDKKWLHEAMEIADLMIESAVPFCCVDKQNWQATNTAGNTGIAEWDEWLNSYHGKTGEEAWDEWLDSLPTLRTITKGELDEYSEKFGVGEWNDWTSPFKDKMIEDEIDALNAWQFASVRSTDSEDEVNVKLLYWDTSECLPPRNSAKDANNGFYRGQEGELQGLRGISELAKIMSSIGDLTEEESERAQKYYDYASQVISFHGMAGGIPKTVTGQLDSAGDKRALFIINAYDLYEAKGDKKFLYWASQVSESILNQETGVLLVDSGEKDFLRFYWSTGKTPEEDIFGLMDTSHANRFAELVRYYAKDEVTPTLPLLAKDMLRRSVNTFLFKIWESDPQVEISSKKPYPTLFRNFPDGNNECYSGKIGSADNPYTLGNVILGWNELSRYDKRVLFITENLAISLVEGTYFNDFSAVEGACDQSLYSSIRKGTANQGLAINAIAEMAFATRPQS